LNYLIPVDANIPTESFLKQKAIDLESVMGTMEEATNKAKIVILDACRNDPFKGWANKGTADKGLAKVDAPDGMLIAFATSPKKTAADGLGRNSPYTEILLQEIVRPNVSIVDMFQDVRTNLSQKYNQISWENTSLLGRFCFGGCEIRSGVIMSNSIRISTQLANQLGQYPKNFTNSMGMKFILAPRDSFMMGSDDSPKSKPIHKVSFDYDFYISAFEVTQLQWKTLMGNNPSFYDTCGDNCPVENVSWNDVQDFISKLNQSQNTYRFRLPTESEWEYSCRAGKLSNLIDSIDSFAWYEKNSGEKTHPVGMKLPNAWGLYDMYGNVQEWVQDTFSLSYTGTSNNGSANETEISSNKRVVRGGSFFDPEDLISPAKRYGFLSNKDSTMIGFRLAAIPK
jgi:formylglycine-generating enzyme required for sulfatase activity